MVNDSFCGCATVYPGREMAGGKLEGGQALRTEGCGYVLSISSCNCLIFDSHSG